jgi:hypothetical protein
MKTYPDPRSAPMPRKRAAGSRAFWLVVVIGCATLFAARTSISTENTVTAPGPVKLSRMSPRTVQEAAELNGVEAGAAAGMAFLAGKDKASGYVSTSTPRSIHPGATKLYLRDIRSSVPHSSKDKALADAVAQAQSQLAEALASLDPPIRFVPTADMVKAEYVVPVRTTYIDLNQEDREALEEAKIDSNRVYAKVDLEVSESQLRQLRGKDRLYGSAKWFGGAFLSMLIAYGFLRFDSFTRGHLTLPLVLAAVAGIVAVVVAVAALR